MRKVEMKAIALATDSVLGNPLGRSLKYCCMTCGIELDTHSVTAGCAEYKPLFEKYDQVITWNCRMPHNWPTARGKNVLFVENALLSQGCGAFVDARGFFSQSNLCRERHWDSVSYEAHAGRVRDFVRDKFKWEAFSGGTPGGPVLVALQNSLDCNMRYEFPFGAKRGGDRLLSSLEVLATHLPRFGDRKVLIRPHPRFMAWWDEHFEEYRGKFWRDEWELNLGGSIYELMPSCSALVAVNSTVISEGMTLGLPIAAIGTGAFSGCGGILECAADPSRLGEIGSFEPDVEACKKYVAAVLTRHQMMYAWKPTEVFANEEFQKWVKRGRSMFRPKALNIGVDWQKKIAESRKANPFTVDVLDRLRNEGMQYLDADAGSRKRKRCCGGKIRSVYLERWERESKRGDVQRYARLDELKSGGRVVLGYFGSAHLGDCVVTTTLPRKLKEKYGCEVMVVRHRRTIEVFGNNPHFDGHFVAGRVALGGAQCGNGTHVQRVERYFDLPEEPFSKGEIYLTEGEQRWANDLRASLPDRPIVVLCNGSGTNNTEDPFNLRPWQAWADVIGEGATVIQLAMKSKAAYQERKNRQGMADVEAILDGHLVLANLPTRMFLAVFSVADAYFGTWAAGSHAAAAFGLHSIVHLNSHLKGWPEFPGSTRLEQFLYPQHSFARWGDEVPLPPDELPARKSPKRATPEEAAKATEAVAGAGDQKRAAAEYEEVAAEIDASIDSEMQALLTAHREAVERPGMDPAILAAGRSDVVSVWRLKRPPEEEKDWPAGS